MMNKPEKWDTAKYPIFFVPIPTLFRDTHHLSRITQKQKAPVNL